MDFKPSIVDDATWQGLVAAQLLRIRSELHEVLAGRSTAVLGERAHPGGNPVGRLAWHLTRSHDRNFSEISGVGQVWIHSKWQETFGRSSDPTDTGTDTPLMR